MCGKVGSISLALLLCFSSTASADKMLAHSKSLGMSFTALGDTWCAPEVRMRVDAADAGKFATPDYGDIIQRLGQVMARECPDAERLSITGMNGDRLVWSGSAGKQYGWRIQQQATAGVAQVPSPASRIPASGPSPAASTAPSETPSAAVPVIMAETPTTSPGPVVIPAAPVSVPQAVAVPESADSLAEPALQMEIAGWKPGEPVIAPPDLPPMIEIPGQEDGCLIRTLAEVKTELNPDYKVSGESRCTAGYLQSANALKNVRATLYYAGQKQPFTRLDGSWFDGYNFQRGTRPAQIVARSFTRQLDNRRRVNVETHRLLVWAGEDRDLRVHYFAGYYYTPYNDWRLDTATPFIVLTDNGELQRNPHNSALAKSLAEMNKTLLGYPSTDHVGNVNFTIVDQLHNAPGHKQLALSIASLDPSLHKEGRAVRARGMPWSLTITKDYAAMRAGQALAEQRRIEAEKQRQEALRARHQERLEQQYQLLAAASRYDQLRFYATLMMEPGRLDPLKVDFSAQKPVGGNPLAGSVQFTHPAQFAKRAVDGDVVQNSPLYLLVKGDDGHVQKPYPMRVDYNETSVKIDGWMLLRLDPKFRFGMDQKGKPEFLITIQDAVPCKSEQCRDELDTAAMIKTWYGDSDLDIAALGRR
ncbi:hypothetical protein [Sedimenticola hydrogenitrophicus]|uniref:hypothetical protein n=1 Tax=Sedimenticola hydrogenitrophicus TaxID=2967975 RepID=UPI0023AF7078|nr:hypothetical protein [Sedimenticola hydrogenitrophicus]